MTNEYLIYAMIIMALCTFALRCFPFLAIKHLKNNSFISFLGKTMPAGIMLILVFYSLTSVDYTSIGAAFPYLISVCMVITMQHFFRKPLLSILAGTFMNIFLLNFL